MTLLASVLRRDTMDGLCKPSPRNSIQGPVPRFGGWVPAFSGMTAGTLN